MWLITQERVSASRVVNPLQNPQGCVSVVGTDNGRFIPLSIVIAVIADAVDETLNPCAAAVIVSESVSTSRREHWRIAGHVIAEGEASFP